MARGGARPGAGRKPKGYKAPKPKTPSRKQVLKSKAPKSIKAPPIQTSPTQEQREKHEEHPAWTAQKWKPGQSGNPKGRPKGARSRLAEAFLGDLYNDWEEHGIEAIHAVRELRPQDYIKVIASILPKQLEVKDQPLDEIGDDDLALAIAAINAARTAGGVGKGPAH